MEHPDEDTLIHYVNGRIGEDGRILFDTHLSDCTGCRERVESMTYLKSNFDTLWSSWTANEHGRAHRRWRTLKALREACAASPQWVDRVKRGIRNLGEGAEMAVKIFVDRAHRIASAAKDLMPEGHGFELSPTMAGVGADDERGKVDRHLKRGSELLEEDRNDEVVGELLEAVKIDARAPQAVTSHIYDDQGWVMQVVADSRRERVSVKYRVSGKVSVPAFALLVPGEGAGEGKMSEFELVEGAEYRLARFEDVADGTFRIEIIPE